MTKAEKKNPGESKDISPLILIKSLIHFRKQNPLFHLANGTIVTDSTNTGDGVMKRSRKLGSKAALEPGLVTIQVWDKKKEGKKHPTTKLTFSK